MKITVLMSTYNGEQYIKKQIESILKQKQLDITLIVRDDGSTDKTIDILKNYEKKRKLKWFAGENMGPARSFMHLLLNSDKFDYYSFSDQDDIWDDDKLIIGVKELEKYKLPACYYCNSRLMNADDLVAGGQVYNNVEHKIVEKNSLANELCAGGAMGCTMIMNYDLVSLIQKYGAPDKLIMHDCFIQAVCKSVGGKIIMDGTPHMSYRQHENNVVGRKAGIISAIKYRFDFLTREMTVSIADHASSILNLYLDILSNENVSLLKLVAGYNRNIFARVRLAVSMELKFTSIKDGAFIRLSILLGKR